MRSVCRTKVKLEERHSLVVCRFLLHDLQSVPKCSQVLSEHSLADSLSYKDEDRGELPPRTDVLHNDLVSKENGVS